MCHKTWIVSRHPGAYKFLAEKGFTGKKCAHLKPQDVKPGDIVVGTLPLYLAAALCARGIEYWHLTIPLDRADRGRGLTVERMKSLDARVERFDVRKLLDDAY